MFAVDLPMPLQAAAPARLLIVDPDPASVRLLRATLADQGYEIDAATNGAEALKRISTTPPEVLLLELALPDMHGLDVVVSLKAAPETRDIVVIVVTSRNGQAAEAAAIRAGAAGYVRKPIDPIAFPDVVASAL
jgi:CheY-like chemotaxis protein